jgi:hypothetical protein
MKLLRPNNPGQILIFPNSSARYIFRFLPSKADRMSLLEDFLENSTTPLSYTHLKKPGLKDYGATSYAARKPKVSGNLTKQQLVNFQ